MSEQAGWFSDPYGRYQYRYHDGTSWTSHVASQGTQQVDPMGASAVVPFVTPQSAVSSNPAPSGTPNQFAATAPAGGALWRFLDTLGPDAKVRPRPDVTVALAGIGGVLVALGIVVLAGDIDDFDDLRDIRGKLAIFSIIVLAGAYAVRLFLQHQRELASAAVGAGAVGIFGLGAAITYTSSSQTLPLLLLTVMYLAAWIAPGLRGRPLMLGLAALAAVSMLASLTDDQQVNVDFGSSNGSGGQGIAFLVFGTLLLLGVFLLDRAGYAGVATSVLVAALIATFAGAFQVVSSIDNTAGAFMLALVGLVVCVVGTHGHRRASVWLGAAVASIGTAAFLFTATNPSSAGAVAVTLVIAGGLLVGGSLIFEGIRANRDKPAPPTSNLPPPPTP